MIFRQLFDKESSTYTYLIADDATKEAALVDPVLEQVERDVEIVHELGLTLVQVLDTHVHADHVTAAGRLRQRCGALTIGGEGGAPCVDRAVHHGDIVRVGSIELHVLSTPGHSAESVSYLLRDRVLTGDALLIRAAGRTDFQNGDAGELYDTLTRVLFRLPEETLVYPAHDYRGRTASTIGEEKRFNIRVAGRSRDEFIAVMNGLHLPEPARLRDAVAANRACGIVEPALQLTRARVTNTEHPMNVASPGGFRNITPAELASLAPRPRIIDVREPDEFAGELGHVPGAELVPLATLLAVARTWDRGQRIVVACRSGSRSSLAASSLAALGFENLMNLDGGMRAYVDAGLPVERR